MTISSALTPLQPFDPKCLSFNPELSALLRTLYDASGPMRVSDLIANVARLTDSESEEDRRSLVSETLKLARYGLVVHMKGRDRLLYLKLTERGREIAAERPRSTRVAMAASVVAVAPLLFSCATKPVAQVVVHAPPPIPRIQTMHAVQMIEDGRLVWRLCAEEACPKPTPKVMLARFASPPPPTDPPPAVVAPIEAPPRPAPVQLDPVAQPSSPRELPRPEERPLPTFQVLNQSLFFRLGSHSLAGPELSILDGVVNRASTADRVTVVGMTDLSGDQALNATLAAKRADGVRQFLERRGVPPERVSMATDISATKAVPAQFAARGVPPGAGAYRRVDVIVSSRRDDAAGR